jgi:OOP family OmpA-OmpF porin
MRSRFALSLLLLAGAFAVPAGPAGAATPPEGRIFWVTPMAGYGFFSEHGDYPAGYPLDDAVLFGGRLGMRLNKAWDLEAGAAFSTAKEDFSPDRGIEADVTNFDGSIMFTPIHWKIGSPYLAAGGGYVKYEGGGVPEVHYGTFEFALGMRTWFRQRMALRLEGRGVHLMSHDNYSGDNRADRQLWAGLDFVFGGAAKDADGDGVADGKDKCPGTPTGATVDATGCPTDADGDGSFDGIDKCAGTPKGATVDGNGCPKDADADSVYDGIDKCADTPRGAVVDASGCPKDADGDGVFDGLDECLNTPTGATVDVKGCPTDADGDSVFDGIDRCPDTPADLRVDAAGCPIEISEKETQLMDTGMIRLQGVNFETGKAVLLPESHAALDEVGTILLKWTQLKIEIGGHTDGTGTAATNQKLSESRAAAVRTYLIQKFPKIVDDQITSKGYGKTRPVAPNTTALNRSKNRRVEFVVLNKDVLKTEIEKRKMLTK